MTFVIDIIAQIRTVAKKTYEEFTWKLVHMLPKGYKTIDLVADTYRVRLKMANKIPVVIS